MRMAASGGVVGIMTGGMLAERYDRQAPRHSHPELAFQGVDVLMAPTRI